MNSKAASMIFGVAILVGILVAIYFSTRPTPVPVGEQEESARASGEMESDWELTDAELEAMVTPDYEALPAAQQKVYDEAVQHMMMADAGALAALIAEHPEAVEWESEGATLLLEALRLKDEPAVLLLIEAGSDVNHDDRMGGSPLNDAIFYGLPEAVPALLEAGADPSFTPGEVGQTPLMVAATMGDIATMELLLDAGADIDQTSEELFGETALFKAVQAYQVDSVRFLLDAGADASITNTITEKNAEQTAIDMYNDPDFFDDKEALFFVIEAFGAPAGG